MAPNDMMNAQEVARVLHLGKNTVYQLAKTGQLASYHVGRKLRFSIEDVEAYMQAAHSSSTGVPATGNATEAGGAPDAIHLRRQDAHASLPAMDAGQDLSRAAAFGQMTGESFRIAGDDVAADILTNSLNASGLSAEHLVRGSYTSLVNLYAGDADAAVVSLYDLRSNSYNTPYVRNLAPGASVIVIRLYACAVGFAVQKGNPKHISSWGALLREGVRLSNRTKGSAQRVLLDEKLRALEARAETIEGYADRAAVGLNAVRRVANGAADVCVVTEREAKRTQGVDFVPLQQAWVDLAIAKTPRTRPLIKRVEELLADSPVAVDLSGVQPCDVSKLGSIVYES